MSAQPQIIDRASAAATQTFSSEELARRTIHRRAVEAVIWGMPMVNYDLMLQAAIRIGGGHNQIVYWSRLPDWKNQTLTPNPDAIYLKPFINTRDAGPMVLEIPGAGDGTIVGSVMDCWQTAIEDVGPAGVDKGRGGKYLLLPPRYKDNVPEGYIPMASDTYQSYALLRSILRTGSDADVAKAVSYGKRVKLYPLSQAVNPPETKFVDAIDAVFDSTIPYDLSFFQCLNRMVQYDPWLTRDKGLIDQLKSIGIEKGKPFQPRHETREILRQAAAEAHAWIEANYESVFKPPFYDNAQWALPASQELLKGITTNYAEADSYPVDARGLTYSYAFFSAKHMGVGQYYLMTITDKDGEPLSGARVYRLNVPANAPVTQYWSATIYNRATHSFIRDMQRVGRSSQSPDLQKNADGSVDIYFAAKAPAGKESNCIPADRTGEFEVLFRFYGPQKPLFDKTWKLPDIEKIA